MAYDSASHLHQATHTPACPSGTGCLGPQTTTSHHNGHGQRFLRTTPQGQSVFVYGTDQYTVLSETHQTSALATTSTEHIYLPTASGTMPVIAIIDGQRFAVHSDHLNTPRRLTDASNRPRWQWAYSAFGDVPAQSLPAAGVPTLSYSLRYPGQVDDFNGLFYNFNRFYDPRVGRYTQSDPIGLDGGRNRFGYADGNPLLFVDPYGLANRKYVNLGEGYTGGIDTFDVNGRASFEIHVLDKNGAEVGLYGPNGWFNKHGLTGRPEGIPESVENQCKGNAVALGRRLRVIPKKGQADITGSKWKGFFRGIPLIGPMIEITTPSPERACNINPNFEGC